MEIDDLVLEAAKDVKPESGKMKAELFCDWLISKGKFDSFLGSIREDTIIPVQFETAKTIDRLKNADMYVSIGSYLALKGHMKEGEEVFKTILTSTPNDTSALNDYGTIILNELLANYRANKQWDRKRLEFAWKQISKAATLDKEIHDEPLLLPAYENLCFLRAVEAAYYVQNEQNLTAFVMAWMSIEMTIYRIWYAYLKENDYSKTKRDKLKGWKLSSIIELLFLSKCNPDFMKIKNDLDTLKGLRDDLLHGKSFEIPEGQTRRCIEVALDIVNIKQK